MASEKRNLTAYERWMEKEGLPVIPGYGLSNLKTLELGLWERLGGRGACVDLVGMEGVTGMYVAEIPPGGALKPEKHLYEEIL